MGYPNLDTDTLYLVIAAAGGALSVIFLFLRRAGLKYRGLTRWALSDGCIAVGFLLLSFYRDSPWISSVCANTLIICGAATLSNGVWAFVERPRRYAPFAYLPPIAALFVLGYFTFMRDLPGARNLTMALMLTIQFAATAAVILYRYPYGWKGAARFTALVFLLLAAWFSYMSATALSRDHLHSMTLFMLAVGIVVWTLGLGLMIAMRLAEELAEHEMEVERLRRDAIVKTIINSIPQSIILKDKDSRYVACNAAFARMVGRTPEDIVGLRDADIYPSRFAEKYVQDDREVIAEGKTREFVERTTNNGEEIWIETIKTPMVGPDGTREGIIVVFRDITQRKRDEDMLLESEKRYRELSGQLESRVKERTKELEQTKRDSDLFFDVTLEYLCLTDFSGRFLKLSPSWTKNLGWKEDELMNRRFIDFIHREDRLTTLKAVRHLSKGERMTDKANRFKRADGSWVWLSWSAVGLPDRGVVLAAAHDITARVETEERMRLARETAEAASQAKSQFISTMSHELRTPLNAVLRYAELLHPLIADERGERGERYIKSIDSSGRALLAIINDILDLTKVESGRIELIPAPFDPRKMLDEIAEIFRFGAEEKGLFLEFKASSALPRTILLDASRLKQVLINLIGNSIKFTESGSVRVSMDAVAPEGARTDDPNAMYTVKLIIRVEDTGIGMSEQYRQRLFEPFSQQDAAIGRKYGGTGLGLAIAKRLLDLMRGAISCESELNKGTRFIIEIPDVRAAGSALEMVSFIGGDTRAAVEDRRPNADGQRGRVLVVGGRGGAVEIVRKALEPSNLEISIAHDAESAAALAKNADLILLDYERELFRMLQGEQAAALQPMILITAKEMHEEALRMAAGGAGPIDFISTPIDEDEVRTRTRVHLKLKKTRDALERKNAEISESKRAMEKKNGELEALVRKLDRLSMTDELTGLSNRRAVSARIAEEVARAKRAGRPITVLMGDLDRFKLINDKLGHDAGDVVLAESAQRFARALRESDSLGRWGGEEFLAVLPETDLAEAIVAAERARAHIGDTPIAYGTELIRATISIGAAWLLPRSADDPEACASALIRAADDALYRAKAKGRNRVEGMAAILPTAPPTLPTEEFSTL